MNIPVPPSILKKTSAYATSPAVPTLAPNKEPPGVPPFPPPELSSDDEDTVENVCKLAILCFIIKEKPCTMSNYKTLSERSELNLNS